MPNSGRFATKPILYFPRKGLDYFCIAYFQKFWFSPIPHIFFRNSNLLLLRIFRNRVD